VLAAVDNKTNGFSFVAAHAEADAEGRHPRNNSAAGSRQARPMFKLASKDLEPTYFRSLELRSDTLRLG
jgi:hypothetical protein